MCRKWGGQKWLSCLCIILINLGLIVGWLVGPRLTLAQVTPGAPVSQAILQPVSGQDNRLTSAPAPASGATLLTAFKAASSGPAAVPLTNFGTVDPANLGVFALQGTALGQEGLNLTAVLDKTLNVAVWVRVPATYNPLRKTLNFSAVNGTIYALFTLKEGTQRSLPDSGSPALTEEGTQGENNFSFLPFGFFFVAILGMVGLLGRLALHNKKTKDKAAHAKQG